MSEVLNEKCGCGAEFHWIGRWPSDGRRAAQEWREQHKHAESVGICGDQAPAITFGDETRTLYCDLKAGHAGAHSDGNGHWQHAEVQDIAESAREAHGTGALSDEQGAAGPGDRRDDERPSGAGSGGRG